MVLWGVGVGGGGWYKILKIQGVGGGRGGEGDIMIYDQSFHFAIKPVVLWWESD